MPQSRPERWDDRPVFARRAGQQADDPVYRGPRSGRARTPGARPGPLRRLGHDPDLLSADLPQREADHARRTGSNSARQARRSRPATGHAGSAGRAPRPTSRRSTQAPRRAARRRSGDGAATVPPITCQIPPRVVIVRGSWPSCRHLPSQVVSGSELAEIRTAWQSRTGRLPHGVVIDRVLELDRPPPPRAAAPGRTTGGLCYTAHELDHPTMPTTRDSAAA